MDFWSLSDGLVSSKSNTLLLVYVYEGGGREGGEGEGGVQLNTKITNNVYCTNLSGQIFFGEVVVGPISSLFPGLHG